MQLLKAKILILIIQIKWMSMMALRDLMMKKVGIMRERDRRQMVQPVVRLMAVYRSEKTSSLTTIRVWQRVMKKLQA
jgi:hypothetical protein